MKFDNVQNTEAQLHVVNQIDVWSMLRKIASKENQEEAFYVCNINDIINKYTIWKTLMPRIRPHYAVKCNDDRTVLEVLAALGSGFDCASKVEINKVLAVGANANRIIFAHPAKPLSHICHAASVGVTTMTFDNECELYKVQRLYPNSKLVIRIRSDAKDVQVNLGEKFGCDPITEAPKLLHIAKSLNLTVIGVSFHVGSGSREPEAYYRSIHIARNIFDYAKTIGYDFTLLDIGGGFPAVYDATFHKMSIIINSAVEEFFPEPDVDVISEPGRYIVGSAYTLASSIHCIKEKISGDDTMQRMYYINDGIYGSLNCVLNESRAVYPLPLNESPDSKIYLSSIWGPTCDGLDLVSKDIMLPEMKIGDWFVFENMGAYSVPIASQFNGFPLPKMHYIINRDSWLLLKNVLSAAIDNFKQARRASLQDHLEFNRYSFKLTDIPATIQQDYIDTDINLIKD